VQTTHAPRHYRAALTAALCLSVLAGAAMSAAPPAAANSPSVCGMLSANQLRSWFGKAMKLGSMSDMPQAQGCQWVPADGSVGGLTAQVVPARYYTEPKLGKGFKTVAGVAQKAYVVPSLGGWEAGALKGTKAVVIRTPETSAGTAIAVLKTLAAKI
jgi:hypothetical protein